MTNLSDMQYVYLTTAEDESLLSLPTARTEIV